MKKWKLAMGLGIGAVAIIPAIVLGSCNNLKKYKIVMGVHIDRYFYNDISGNESASTYSSFNWVFTDNKIEINSNSISTTIKCYYFSKYDNGDWIWEPWTISEHYGYTMNHTGKLITLNNSATYYTWD